MTSFEYSSNATMKHLAGRITSARKILVTSHEKPDGDAIQDLSVHNYHVMRDFVGDPKFLLQKKIEAKLSEKYPDKWMPLYSQVTFSSIPYKTAWEVGQRQEAIMKEIMQLPNIEEIWDRDEVEQKIMTRLG